jgi:hypothetical protein
VSGVFIMAFVPTVAAMPVVRFVARHRSRAAVVGSRPSRHSANRRRLLLLLLAVMRWGAGVRRAHLVMSMVVHGAPLVVRMVVG